VNLLIKRVKICVMKVKVKLSLHFINKTPLHEDVWGSEGSTPHFLASSLGGGKLLASHLCPFSLWEDVYEACWTGGWIVLTASMDAIEK
jgi:hypothetical protein